MVAECMQVVPVNFEKSRLTLDLAKGETTEAARGLRAPLFPTLGVVNKGCFYKQTPEPLLSNVYDGV